MAKINGFTVWDDEFIKEFFSAEEIEASNIRVALMGAIIQARNEQKVSQRDLGRLFRKVTADMKFYKAILHCANKTDEEIRNSATERSAQKSSSW